MISVKESKRKEDLQALHTELWTKLQEQEEGDAERLLQSWIAKLDNPRPTVLETIKSAIASKWFWIAVIVGCTSVPLLFSLFVWAALRVE